MADPRPLASSEIRVLFRYRDLVANTVEEHRKIIQRKGSCWWGWWKRPNEPNRDEVWEQIQAEINQHGDAIVGLFDSGATTDALAVRRVRVKEIIRPLPRGAASGVPPVPAGQEQLVPTYYRDSPFSRAWLKITEIETEPIPFFGEYSYDVAPPLPGIPQDNLIWLAGKVVIDHQELRAMDTTIWQVRPKQVHDRKEKFLAASIRITKPISTAPILVKGDTILHLTDMHFAKVKREQHMWGYPTDTPKRVTLAEAVHQAVKEKKVGVVVISGDFTFAAVREEFDEAYKAINSLLGSLGLGPEHVVIVPGNHDIAWARLRDDKYDPAKPVENAPDAAKAEYLAFYRKLLVHQPNDDFSMGRRFVFPHGIVVEVCALNSSSLEQGPNYLAGMGMVRTSVFNDVREELGWNKPDGSLSFRVLVLHHHLTATEDVEDPAEYGKGFGMAIDAKSILREAAGCGVHLALHGHRHRVFVWREGVYRLPEHAEREWRLGNVSILGGGSAGSTEVKNNHNYFNLIRVSSRGIHVEIFRSERTAAFRPMPIWEADFHLSDGKLHLDDWHVETH